MTVSLQRIDQIHKPDTFNDQLSAAQVAAIEGAAVDYADYNNAVISQLKRIIHGGQAGDWYADIETTHGADASLYALYNRATLENKLIILWRLNLTDITVTAASNVQSLDAAGEPPSRPIAFGATTKGAVCAQLPGSVGTHSLSEVSGQNALRPKNLCAVYDGDTGDPILSDGRRIWALLQVGNLATDGNSFAISGNDLGQLSFVRATATNDDLEACPAADIGGLKIIYAYSDRNDLQSHAEDAFRGELGAADPNPPGFGGLDAAYTAGSFINVDGNDVDIRLDDTKSWVFRKGTGGALLARIVRNDAGTDLFEISSAIDSFDVNAADSDFAQGMSVDTADQTINIGKTAVGVIDSSSIETRATAGDNIVRASADVKFTTVRETALPLDDATTGAISALTGGPHASIAAAISYAITAGGVNLSVKVFVAASNYAQGVNIPAATFDLTAYTIDMNTPANTDAFVFLNGRLLHGGNVTTKNDVYVGDTAANGDIKVDFAKGIKTGDVIISIGLQ